jgi:hypothetical protein
VAEVTPQIPTRSPGLATNVSIMKLTALFIAMLTIAVGFAPPGAANPATSIPHDGTYMVGSDVAPGQYFTPGGVSGGACIWQRLSSLTDPGDFSNFIDSGMSVGQQYAVIKASDKAFKTTNCQTWVQK